MYCNRFFVSLCAWLACASFAVHATAPQAVTAESADASDAALVADSASKELQPSEPDEYASKILDAMGEASTVGHPDLRGLFDGMRAFYRGDYQLAMDSFLEGARYAGKQSQLTIGLMYLKGHGVEKDPATACAWLALAAERGYPRYEATRKEVCNTLSRQQHARALKVLDRLVPEYGDEAAVPRMKRALARGMRRSITGSYLGTDHGVVSVYPNRAAGKCRGLRLQIGVIVIPKQGCGTYDSDLWHPDKYFTARVPRVRGIVTVGELDEVPESEAERGEHPNRESQPAADVGDED